MENRYMCRLYGISSKGMLPKKIVTKNNKEYIIKYSSYGCNEAISEVIVSKLLDILNIEHIEYIYNGVDSTCGYNSHTCICEYKHIDNKCRKVGLYKFCLEDAILN